MKVYLNVVRDTLKRNRKLYIPYIGICSLFVFLFFIFALCAASPEIRNSEYGVSKAGVYQMGYIVLGFFSYFIINYAGSLIIKSRGKEQGLLMLLGFSKKDLGIVEFLITLFTSIISMVFGILISSVFGKIIFAAIQKSLDISVKGQFDIKPYVQTVFSFGIIFLIILVINQIRTIKFSPIKFMEESKKGDRIKANKYLGILGFILCFAGYYIANAGGIVRNDNVLLIFMEAVILVIVGTNLLFSEVSVLIMGLLKKKRSYFFKKDNFLYLTGMMHRVRKSASSLAGIAILLTMSLITMASFASIFLHAKELKTVIGKGEYNITVRSERDLNELKEFMDAHSDTFENYEVIKFTDDTSEVVYSISFDSNKSHDELNEIISYINLKDGHHFETTDRLQAGIVGIYGDIIYVAIFLTVAFLFSCIMLMYYKQYFEGMEDRSRFKVMKNVGMTSGEIKKTVSKQMRAMLIAPIVVALIHSLGAVNVVTYLLTGMQAATTQEYIVNLLLSFGIITVIYLIASNLLSKVYYNLVK